MQIRVILTRILFFFGGNMGLIRMKQTAFSLVKNNILHF